ncbi:hypothetical protein L9F63_009201, partial [Diploptera punctata]
DRNNVKRLSINENKLLNISQFFEKMVSVYHLAMLTPSKHRFLNYYGWISSNFSSESTLVERRLSFNISARRVYDS